MRRAVSEFLLRRGTGAMLLLLGVAASFLGPPVPTGRLLAADIPLNWDLAGHLLHAEAVRDAWLAADWQALVEQLRLWSVYPPLYHFALGSWFAFWGTSAASARVFLWLVPGLAVLGCWLGFRTTRSRSAALGFLAVAVLLAGLAHFTALARSWMLDAPGAALAVFSLGLLGRYADSSRSRLAPAVAVAILATILVKYNFGLPLLVSVAVLGLTRCRRGGGDAAASWNCWRSD